MISPSAENHSTAPTASAHAGGSSAPTAAVAAAPARQPSVSPPT